MLVLLHVPPDTELVKVTDEPAHTAPGPPNVPGNGLTVTIALTVQPVEAVYTIVVVPAATPVTIPVPAPTDPVVGALLLHIPNDVASVKAVVEPIHTLNAPVIAATAVGWVTVAEPVAVQPLASVTV